MYVHVDSKLHLRVLVDHKVALGRRLAANTVSIQSCCFTTAVSLPSTPSKSGGEDETMWKTSTRNHCNHTCLTIMFFSCHPVSNLANQNLEGLRVPPCSIQAGRQISIHQKRTCGIPCPCLDKCRNNPFSTFGVWALLAPAPAAIRDVT